MSDEEPNKILSFFKKRKRILIGITTLLLIIFMLFIVDFPEFLIKISTIGLWGTLLFVAMYTLAFIFRTIKMKLIFKGIEKNIKFSTSYFSIGASFVINEFTPGKLGDIAKIFIIKDQEDILLSESVAGIAIERVLDLILLFVISCFSLIYLYISRFGEIQEVIVLGQNIQFYLIVGAILIIGFIILIMLVLYKTEYVLKIIRKISTKIANYIEKFLNNFKRGMKNFKDHRREFFYVILLSFPTWIIDALIISIFFYILGYHVNILLLVLAMILLFFSKTFPITPGGWGISENIGAVFIFIFYPLLFPAGFTDILSIFIIDHLFRSVYIFIYGGYSVFHYNFSLKKSKELVL
ncbi:MAG: YbhN family protein [Promethearchaeota archaeon]